MQNAITAQAGRVRAAHSRAPGPGGAGKEGMQFGRPGRQTPLCLDLKQIEKNTLDIFSKTRNNEIPS